MKNDRSPDGLSVMQLHMSGYEESMSALARPGDTDSPTSLKSQDLVNLFLEKRKNIHAIPTVNDLSLGIASQGVSLVTNQKGVTCTEDPLEADPESSQSCDNGCHETTKASLSSSSALLISLKKRSKMITKDMTSPPKKN